MRRLLSGLLLPLLPAIGAALRVQQRSTSQVLHYLHGRAGSQSGNASRPTLFCFSVVRPGYEADLSLVHLHAPMLAACDGYSIFSNVSLMELVGQLGAAAFVRDAGRGTFAQAVNGSMDVKWSGWPAENPRVFSAENTPVFKQAWQVIFREGMWKQYDWVVKVDPDTVLFPDRLRMIVQGRNPQDKMAFFDGGEMCPTGMGGLAVLSRGVVEVIAAYSFYFLELPVWKEDGLLVAIAKDFLHVPIINEPNLVVNPAIGGCHLHWKAAYHPHKDVPNMLECLKVAPYAAAPSAAELHTKCT